MELLIWILMFVKFTAFALVNTYLFLLGIVVSEYRREKEKDSERTIAKTYQDKIGTLEKAIREGDYAPLVILPLPAAVFTFVLAVYSPLPLILGGVVLFLFFTLTKPNDKWVESRVTLK